MSGTQALSTLTAAGFSKTTAAQIAEEAGAIEKVSKLSAEAAVHTTGLSVAFKGLGKAAVAGLKSLATNPLTWLVTGVAAAGIALYNYNKRFENAVEDAKESASAYAETASDITSLNNELETTKERISELQALKDAGTITLSEEAELSSLQAQNAELERQIALKEQLAAEQAAEVISDTREALSIEDTDNPLGTYTDYAGNTYRDENGGAVKTDILTATQDQIDAIRDLKSEREELTKELESLGDGPSDRKDEINARIQDIDSDLDEYTSNVSENIQTISDLRDGLTDATTGLAIEGLDSEMQSQYDWMTNLIDDFNNIDLSPTERSLKNLDKFFDGSKGSDLLKERLTDAASSTETLEEALRSMGLSLDELGVDNIETLQRYLQEASKSADAAAESLKRVQDTEAISAVADAFESQNAGYNYEQAVSYAEKAAELYDQDLIGTDDFKSFTDYMTYGFNDSLEAYEAGIDKFNRYFTTDSAQGVQNFIDDLVEKSETLRTTWATKENGAYKFDIDNVAAIAKEMGLGVGAVEDIFGRLQDYGFDIDFTSAIDDLKEYESALSNLQDLYDSMDDGEEKDALGRNIEQWESDLQTYQNDLAQLDEEKIVKIKLEYDLASLRQEINQLEKESSYGDRNVSDNAKILASKESYRETRESETGYTEQSSETYAQTYAAIEKLQQSFNDNLTESETKAIQQQIDGILDLQNAFQDAFANGEVVDWDSFLATDKARDSLNQILEDTGMTRQEFADLLGTDVSNLWPDQTSIKIDAELDATQLQEQIDSLDTFDKLTFKATIQTDTGELESEVNVMRNLDGTVTYTASVDGVLYELEPVINQDGTVTYTIVEKLGSQVEEPEDSTATVTVNEVQGSEVEPPQDSTTTVTVNEVQGSQVETPPDSTTTVTVNEVQGSTVEEPTNQSATVVVNAALGETIDQVPDASGQANFSLGESPHKVPNATGIANFLLGSYPTTLPAATQTVIRRYINGGSQATGTAAFANGTGYAYAGGGYHDISLPYDQNGLVGELGSELLVRNGKWHLIGTKGAEFIGLRKGDIIFNHKQTVALFKNGNILGRGTPIGFNSHAMGTVSGNAFAGSVHGSGMFRGGASSSSSSSSSSGNTYVEDNSTTNYNVNVGSTSTSSEDTPDPETFDWIERKIKKLQEETEHWKRQLESLTTFKAQNSYIDKTIESIQAEVRNLNDSYNAYLSKANSLGLSADYVNKIQNGLLNIEDITDEDLKEKINDYQDWYDKAVDCQVSIEELNQELIELKYQKLDNIIDDFDNINSYIEKIISNYESMNELAQEQGKILTAQDYESVIKYNNALKDSKQKELDTLQAEFDNLMANQENFIGTDKYFELQEEMMSLKNDIADVNLELEDIKDNIHDANWYEFTKSTEENTQRIEELDRALSLLNENNLFSENGALTSTGLTKYALLGQQLHVAQQQVAEYENAIIKLGEDLANGNITQEEYNDTLNDYRTEAQNAQKDVKDYKDAIIELTKEGIEKQIAAQKELINARKEALQTQKDYDDYQKQIDSKNKDILSVQSQLAMLEGQSGRDVERQRRELEAQLKQLQDEKQELIDDRSYDMLLNGYDELADEIDEKYDEFVNKINSSVEEQDKIIDQNLQNVANNYGTVADELNKVGVSISDAITAPWKDGTSATKEYLDTINNATSNSNIDTGKINTDLREEQNIIKDVIPDSTEEEYKPPTTTTQEPAQSTPTSPNDLGLDPSPDTKGLSWLAKDVSVHDRMLWNGWATTDRNYRLLHTWAGGTGEWKGTSDQNINILNKLKQAGFAEGGIARTVKSVGEDGIALVKNGESLFSAEQTPLIRSVMNDVLPQLYDLSASLPSLENFIHTAGNISGRVGLSESNTEIHIDNLLTVEGNVDKYVIDDLKDLLNPKNTKLLAAEIGKEMYRNSKKLR